MAEKGKPKKSNQRRKKPDDAKEVREALEAEAGGGKGPRDDTYSTVQRNIDIFRAHLRSIDTYDLAAMYELHPKTVEGIIRDMRREHRRITQANPLDVIEELTAQIDAGISELARETTKVKGAQRINAITQRLRALLQKAAFLREVGVLPKSPDTLRVQIDTAGFVERLLDLLDRRDLLDDELVAAIEAEFVNSGGMQINLDADDIEEEDIEAIALGSGE